MKIKIVPGIKIGKLTVIEKVQNSCWHCVCECGNHSYPTNSNLSNMFSKSCGSCVKNYYRDCDDGISVEVTVTNGEKFYIDKEDEPLVRQYKWYIYADRHGVKNVCTKDPILIYQLIMGFPENMEIDHIDLDRLNNRKSNLRLCTHQQNQMNQPLQKNNTSGVTGVRFYKARNKYVARIKVCQRDIHLGYYVTFEEAVQARNVGMECMFGEFGRYNDVPPTPEWIRKQVIEKCTRFAELSVSKAFLLSCGIHDGEKINYDDLRGNENG